MRATPCAADGQVGYPGESMSPRFLTVVLSALLGAGTSAQTTSYIAPFGYQSNTGDSNNTIPWRAGSATYQQIHNASDLAWVFPGPVAIIRGISFRPASTYTLIGRSLDAQITLSATTVSSTTATATFATNLGPSPTVTLPYTTITLPNAPSTAVPNPQTWFFPFQTPFPYSLTAGNLCWEMRTKNSTSTVSSFTDAATIPTPNACFMPLLGSGCIATGQTQPATIGVRSLAVATGAFTNQLDRGAISAPAAMVLGLVAQPLTLPSLCAALETVPVLSFNGTTDALGTWNLGLTLGNLSALPRSNVYAQFAFADANLPYGFGLSACSPVTLPGPTSTFSAVRIYVAPSQGGQGNENALTGTVGMNYGLVTGFDR